MALKVYGECVFCGTYGELSREHMWPDWMNEAFPGIRDAEIHSGRFGDPNSQVSWKPQETFGHKIAAPCARCNTTWMSRIETAVIPVLPPMANAERGYPFDVRGQTALAFWTLKTAIVQALMEQPCPVPAEHYRFLFNHGRRRRNWRLPNNVFIWLSAVGRFKPSSDGIVNSVFGNPTKPAALSQPYTITLRLFHLVMRVIFDPGHILFPVQIGSAYAPFLVRIWPPQRPGTWWPPETVLQEYRDFEAMARMFDPRY